ncbi:dehydrogenase/reductase SDR family member 11-like [Sphaerodactylus townsendi]|uniref:dehydrogenase/reductase SDR family member 11-like n=1 Tax=Sphaerodactylus townsendi TaxID=933632 RepID=UPI002025E62A|nr:dehydrogenase/reductase SDR family member 11-like [Sphaerodactylus townsendi]
MERWQGRVALVTGASVGIGAAVARALVQQGMKVVGCARSVDKIEKLAAECQSAGFPGTLIPYKCDLSVEEEILSMFSAIKTLHQGVDICINNAGLALPEPLLSGKTEGWRTMLDYSGSQPWGRAVLSQELHTRLLVPFLGSLEQNMGSSPFPFDQPSSPL